MIKKIKYSFHVCLKNHYTCICYICLLDLHNIHFFVVFLEARICVIPFQSSYVIIYVPFWRWSCLVYCSKYSAYGFGCLTEELWFSSRGGLSHAKHSDQLWGSSSLLHDGWLWQGGGEGGMRTSNFTSCWPDSMTRCSDIPWWWTVIAECCLQSFQW